MTIPDGFGQATILMGGTAAPLGAAMVFGTVRNIELTAEEHATAIFDIIADSNVGEAPTTLTFESCVYKFGPDETGATGISTDIPRAGVNSSAAASPQNAYLLTKSTALGGRRGKGRLFLPGVIEERVSQSGAITPVVVETLTDNWNGILANLETAGVPMVLLHGPSTEWVLVGGQPRRVPIAGEIPEPTPVTSIACSSTVATQRRRVRR